ncbi:MAG TPA: hypothetical protein VGS57_20010 [Thermoanaerobaculia bacterium]|jgi:hypothetical protein|nr:hypothetical protein [Thermoanaerobaculia bacterium]
MSSVAEEVRQLQRQELARLTPAERVALALRLGRRDVETFAATQGVGIEEARLLLRRREQRGRRPSRCMDPDD